MLIAPVHDQVVVAGQAEVAALARQGHAAVRLGAVAHEVAEAPDLVHARRCRRPRARPRRPAGCRGCRRAGRCASGGFYSVRTMEASGACATSAGDRSSRSSRPERPPSCSGRAATSSSQPRWTRNRTSAAAQIDRAEDFRSPQRSLGRGGMVARAGHAHADRSCARRAGVFDRLARRPLLGAAAAGGRYLARARRGEPAASTRWRTQRSLRRGPLHPVLGAAGRRTWPSRGASAVFAGGGRPRWRSRWCAASLARWWMPALGRGGRDRRDHHLALPGGHRPYLQQLRHAPARAHAQPGARAGAQARGVDVGEVYRVDASRRDHRRQRLRERARAQPSAWCSTTP